MVQLGKRFLAEVDPIVAFLSLNNRKKFRKESWHTSNDVNRGTGMQLIDPVDHHDWSIVVTACLKPYADLINKSVQIELDIPKTINKCIDLLHCKARENSVFYFVINFLGKVSYLLVRAAYQINRDVKYFVEKAAF